MKRKHIYHIHYSRLDVGFTRGQVALEQLQADFLDPALDLLEATRDGDPDSQPRWTIAVHQQLKLWLEWSTPEKVDRLKQYIREGRIGLGAIPYNTTPLSSPESLSEYRKNAAMHGPLFAV